jgi:hypothetical protein
MAIECIPNFADVASIAQQLDENTEVANIEVSGILVECDLMNGHVRIPRERHTGGLTEVYSDEVHRTFIASVEAALVMKMQMVLIERLETLQDRDLKKFIKVHKPDFSMVEPDDIQKIVLRLIAWSKPPVLNIMTLFQPNIKPSPMKEALNFALSQQDVSQLNSLRLVNEIVDYVSKHIPTSSITPHLG